MIAAEDLSEKVGVNQACEALNVPRALFYRERKRKSDPVRATRVKQSSPRALAADERERVRETLYSERFMDKSLYQVYAALLDDGEYLCSVRTMYRILKQENASAGRAV